MLLWMSFPNVTKICNPLVVYEECSDSVVECLTRDQGVAGSSLPGGTALCP